MLDSIEDALKSLGVPDHGVVQVCYLGDKYTISLYLILHCIRVYDALKLRDQPFFSTDCFPQPLQQLCMVRVSELIGLMGLV